MFPKRAFQRRKKLSLRLNSFEIQAIGSSESDVEAEPRNPLLSRLHKDWMRFVTQECKPLADLDETWQS